MNMFPRIVIITIVGSSLVGLGRNALYAADPRLDLAQDFLVKAKALVEAAEDPGAKKPFGGHADKASSLIERALKEIQLAKQAADKPPKN